MSDPICKVIKFGRVPAANEDHSESGSDMDTSSDPVNEVYGGQYPLASSTKDYKIQNGAWVRYSTPIQMSVNNMNNDPSSMKSCTEPVRQKQGTGMERFQRHIADEELSESATSTEVSFMHSASTVDTEFYREAHTSYDNSSNATTPAKFGKTIKQDLLDKKLQNKTFSCEAVPCAPSIYSGDDIEEMVEGRASRENQLPGSADWKSCPGADEPKSSFCSQPLYRDQNGGSYGIPELLGRFPVAKDVNAAANSLPPCIPTFHASGLGPWCAMISYDACVRLCLNSWAKGCTEEAPYFLNNECALLRKAFGGLGPWCAMISYDACVRLCLNSWAKGCTEEAPYFLNNECALLRKAFGSDLLL